MAFKNRSDYWESFLMSCCERDALSSVITDPHLSLECTTGFRGTKDEPRRREKLFFISAAELSATLTEWRDWCKKTMVGNRGLPTCLSGISVETELNYLLDPNYQFPLQVRLLSALFFF